MGNYYNNNAKEYYKDTIKADISKLYVTFINKLKKGASILDAGCGSGRDSLYFQDAGYSVTAMDASDEMVKLTSKLINKKVFLKRFQDINWNNKFDGIWACASLLHVSNNEIVDVFIKLSNALKVNGIIQASFKYGHGQRKKGERTFLDMNEKDIKEIINKIQNLNIVDIFITNDVRKGRENEKWLNVVIKKDR